MKISVGDSIPAWHMPSVRPERMRTMAAILRDPNPVHWDTRVVARLGFGEHTINQGPLGLSYMINMLHEWTGPGSIRRIYMTFPKVVLDGDDITAMGSVTAVREVDGATLADCDIWLQRSDGDRPLAGTATVALPGG
ncbi:MAG: MaoC/PaaZ C-terminal domain-containing protein [Pseudomonadales bacterium]